VRCGAHNIPRGVWAAVGLFMALTLFYGLRIGFDPIIERFLALDQGSSRLDYWGRQPADYRRAPFRHRACCF
jgi:hypothetical protein